MVRRFLSRGRDLSGPELELEKLERKALGDVLKVPGKVVRRQVEVHGISQFAAAKPARERPNRPRSDILFLVYKFVFRVVVSPDGVVGDFMEGLSMQKR